MFKTAKAVLYTSLKIDNKNVFSLSKRICSQVDKWYSRNLSSLHSLLVDTDEDIIVSFSDFTPQFEDKTPADDVKQSQK